MSNNNSKSDNLTTYNANGTVILTPALAEKLSETNNAYANHVVVTTVNPDSPTVAWTEVDKNELYLPYSANRIPSSKVVGDIKARVLDNAVNIIKCENNIASIHSSVDTLSTEFHEFKDNTNIENLTIDIAELSNKLSGLFCQHAVKFIGVSETDPLCGIVTIDGNRYVVSTDFNESNNGNIVYYKTTILNHRQNNGSQDQHEPEEAITVMYAYIYANGIWNDSGSIQSNDDGNFHKFGYSFYNNLSTLIHDDMVCDYANIKISKISGLQAEIDQNTIDHAYLSGRIRALSNNLSIYQLKTSSEISANMLNSNIIAADARIDQLSNDLSNYLPLNIKVGTLDGHINSDTVIPSVQAVKDKISDINTRINTTNANLENLELSVNSLTAAVAEISISLQSSINNILNILSATLRPEPTSVNKHNQEISNYTW